MPVYFVANTRKTRYDSRIHAVQKKKKKKPNRFRDFLHVRLIRFAPRFLFYFIFGLSWKKNNNILSSASIMRGDKTQHANARTTVGFNEKISY